MKRGKGLARKTPLKARKGLKDSDGGPKRTKMAPKNRSRLDRLFRRCFHSDEFVAFTKAQPCVCGGLICDGQGGHTSHDPTRGAGGTWMDTHPASPSCHALIEVNDFWHRIGTTREAANRAHHMAWLEHLELQGHFAEADDDTCECGSTFLRWKQTDRHVIYRCERGHEWFVDKPLARHNEGGA